MPNKLFRKGLVVGIIVLFIGVSVLSCVSSKDVSISDEKNLEDNKEIELLDNYKEIITWITGDLHGQWEKKRGFIRGEATFWRCPRCSGVDLFGLRYFNGNIKIYKEHKVFYVEVPHYIGYVGLPVMGIALGNIAWSK